MLSRDNIIIIFDSNIFVSNILTIHVFAEDFLPRCLAYLNGDSKGQYKRVYQVFMLHWRVARFDGKLRDALRN